MNTKTSTVRGGLRSQGVAIQGDSLEGPGRVDARAAGRLSEPNSANRRAIASNCNPRRQSSRRAIPIVRFRPSHSGSQSYDEEISSQDEEVYTVVS